MAYALRFGETLITFIECLAKRAAFEISEIVSPLFDHFRRYKGYQSERTNSSLRVYLTQTFFHLFTLRVNDLISAILAEAVLEKGHLADMLIAYSLWEKVLLRKEPRIANPLKASLIRHFETAHLQITIARAEQTFSSARDEKITVILNPEVSFALKDCLAD